MVQITSCFLAVAFTFPLLASAVPFDYGPRSVSGLPADASYITLDETKDGVIAFDASGKKLGAYNLHPKESRGKKPEQHKTPPPAQNTNCTQLTAAEVQKLPGWSKLEEQAKKNWGKGKWEIATNPDKYKNQQATLCVVSTENAKVTLTGKPKCEDKTSRINAQPVGTNGSVTVASSPGSHMTQLTTVTKNATIGAGLKVSTNISIPATPDWSNTEILTRLELRNATDKSYPSLTDMVQKQTITIEVPEGSTCGLEFKETTCDYTGTGKVRYLASGWVWFNYKSKTKGHYKWALNMNEVLKNQDDRSSFMEFKVDGKIESKGGYKGVCKQKN